MQASQEPRSSEESATEAPSPIDVEESNIRDEERGLLSPHKASALASRSSHSNGQSSASEEETELQVRARADSSSSNYIKRKTSQLLEAVTFTSQSGDPPLSPRLASLVDQYASSEVAESITAEIAQVRQNGHSNGNGGGPGMDETRDVALESGLLRGRKRASWATQFSILSGRAFKNLYRDPALLAAHYMGSVALACESTLFLLGAKLAVSATDGMFCCVAQ